MGERTVQIAESMLRSKIEAIVYHCVNEAEKTMAAGGGISCHELDKMITERTNIHFLLYL